MILASDLFKKAGIQLNDADHTRWPLSELALWLNDAVAALLTAKPSASSKSIIKTLVRGTLQTLEVDDETYPKPFQLLHITRNLRTDDPDNREGGRTIRPTTQAQLDAQAPDWHNPSAVKFQKEVRQYVFDERAPLEFYVYPGNNGEGVVEAIVSFIPQPVAAIDDIASNTLAAWEVDVGLPEPYSVPLLDYLLFRANGKDDTAANPGKGMSSYQLFAQALGIKVQAEAASTPNRRAS